ncbi:hypothetical protein OTB19_42715, partial [Streptomyces sp. H27-H5]|nr:hypothetical protein [Streptomyces sp. H27-H5]
MTAAKQRLEPGTTYDLFAGQKGDDGVWVVSEPVTVTVPEPAVPPDPPAFTTPEPDTEVTSPFAVEGTCEPDATAVTLERDGTSVPVTVTNTSWSTDSDQNPGDPGDIVFTATQTVNGLTSTTQATLTVTVPEPAVPPDPPAFTTPEPDTEVTSPFAVEGTCEPDATAV